MIGQEVFYRLGSGWVLLLAERKVAALGKDNSHVRPGYGAGDILLFISNQFLLKKRKENNMKEKNK